MKITQKLLDNIGKLFFVVFALLCIGVPFYEYYLKHNYPTRYTIGYVLGTSHMSGEGDPGMDFFYVVDGRIIKSSTNDEELRSKKLGDSIIVKYILNDPDVADIVQSVSQGDTCEHPYISDSVKYTMYYSH